MHEPNNRNFEQTNDKRQTAEKQIPQQTHPSDAKNTKKQSL